MLMEVIKIDVELFLRVIYACVLGCIIGWERERHGRFISAGIRTYGAIALGACAFCLVGIIISPADPTRVAANIITGIGFLGGGIIFRQGDYVTGLTTAATLWATASVGMCAAFGMYFSALVISFILFLLLYLPRLTWWKKISAK